MKIETQKTEFAEYLKQEEKNELEYSGIEADDESTGEDTESDGPYEVQNIRVAQKMITVYQIEHWISAKNGTKLELFPEYQRNLVWDDQRKSALIESLMLRIPIPAFYLDEDNEGNKSVIDGMQRLTTIHSFLNNEFALKKLQYLSDCENKYFRDLEPKLRARIEDTELAVNILDERCPQPVKFDIFRRLNTGGLPLNDQEIRNIMAQPGVRILLREMASCEEFLCATNGGVKDIRMGAQELCLRYLTILGYYDWDKRDFREYRGLKKMMDRTILALNDMIEDERKRILITFRRVMSDCYRILGENSFCKPGQKKVNKSLFTGWAVIFTNRRPDAEIEEKNIEHLRDAYQRRLEYDTEFYNAITSSTGTRKHIVISINRIRGLWEEYFDTIA